MQRCEGHQHCGDSRQVHIEPAPAGVDLQIQLLDVYIAAWREVAVHHAVCGEQVEFPPLG